MPDEVNLHWSKFHHAKFWSVFDFESACCLQAFMRAWTKYWTFNCEGLPKNEAMLRAICFPYGIDNDEWGTIRKKLFGKDPRFFELKPDGKWHNQEIREEFFSSKEKSQKAKDAVNARWERNRKFPVPTKPK